MEALTLYQFESCPFCARVRTVLDRLALKYTKVEVPGNRSDPLRQELLEKSGVATVPVLRIGDKYIGESAHIIVYLEKHFA